VTTLSLKLLLKNQQEIGDTIGQLTCLEELNVVYLEAMHSFTKMLTNLKNLKHLNFFKTSLSNTQLKLLSESTKQLSSLNIGRTSLSSSIYEDILTFSFLTKLSVQNIRLKDHMINQLKVKLPALTDIDLSVNDNIQAPIIHSNVLKILNLNTCPNITEKIDINCPNLQQLILTCDSTTQENMFKKKKFQNKQNSSSNLSRWL